MSVRKSDDFIADVERQFEWYAVNAGWDVASNPSPPCKPAADSSDASTTWTARRRRHRVFAISVSLSFPPVQRHVLFYELLGDDVVMRRAMQAS
jgi:hypothetical protein